MSRDLTTVAVHQHSPTSTPNLASELSRAEEVLKRALRNQLSDPQWSQRRMNIVHAS